MIYRQDEPFWHFNSLKWENYFKRYSNSKPSTGLCAVFCAIDELDPKTIHLAGFDALLDGTAYGPHDMVAERKALCELGVEIIDVRDNGTVS